MVCPLQPPLDIMIITFVIYFVHGNEYGCKTISGRKKIAQLGVFLFLYHQLLSDRRYSQTFTARRTTTIQNITTRACSHFFTEPVCFYTTCFRWLICSFCCHCFILLLNLFNHTFYKNATILFTFYQTQFFQALYEQIIYKNPFE